MDKIHQFHTFEETLSVRHTNQDLNLLFILFEEPFYIVKDKNQICLQYPLLHLKNHLLFE